ncbi:MAG: dTDP-4-dehydrorhamnose reductase family protein [Pseudobdellovibrionaceae bacterium]
MIIHQNSIVVLGCSGMLGHKLMQTISETTDYHVYGTVRTTDSSRINKLPRNKNTTIVGNIDADNLNNLQKLLIETRPVAVVNCIGIVKQLPEGSQPIPSIKINSLLPHQLAEMSQKVGSRFFHFSTDCVYSGTKGFYNESDATDPQDLYGKSKAICEVGGPGCFTIRSSIIGPELDSHLGLFEWFCRQKGKRVKGYRNALYTGFTTAAMSRILIMLIEKFPEMSGVWNVASNPISKYEILCKINKVLNLGITIDEDQSYAMNRTLDGSKFQKATDFIPPSWDEMISQLAQDNEIRRRFLMEAEKVGRS